MLIKLICENRKLFISFLLTKPKCYEKFNTLYSGQRSYCKLVLKFLNLFFSDSENKLNFGSPLKNEIKFLAF